MKTTCYLQVEPEFATWRYPPDNLYALHVRRVTKTKPQKPLAGTLLVKLTLDIADIAFKPLEPVVDVVIPAHLTEAVTAEAAEIEVAA